MITFDSILFIYFFCILERSILPGCKLYTLWFLTVLKSMYYAYSVEENSDCQDRILSGDDRC